MKRFHQREDIPVAEATTEITGGGGIRNAFRSECTQIGFILPSEFKMFQTCSASEQIESNVQHMIGFTVWQMHFEDRTYAIDVLGETELLHHLLNHSESTGTNGLDSVAQLILNRRREQSSVTDRSSLLCRFCS